MVSTTSAMVTTGGKAVRDKWLLDSGAANHVSNSTHAFHLFEPQMGRVQVGNIEHVR